MMEPEENKHAFAGAGADGSHASSSSSSSSTTNPFNGEAGLGGVPRLSTNSPFVAASDSEGKDSAPQFSDCVVHAPEIRGGNKLTQYHVYKITTTPAVVDHVYRRFSDFDWLFNILMKAFPGVWVPPLPPKKIFGSMDDALIASRRPALERFLRRVSKIPILAESPFFVQFLTRATTFEEAMKQMDKDVDTRQTAAVSAQYVRYFSKILSLSVPQNAEIELMAMKEFLTAEEDRLSKLVVHAQELCDGLNKTVATLSKMNSVMQQLYTVEKGYPALPGPPRLDVLETFSQWHVDAKESEPAHASNMHAMLVHEHADKKVMIDVLHARAVLKAKYDKSKAKALKWSEPNAVCTSDKQKAQKEHDLKTEEDEAALLDCVTKVILLHQLHALCDDNMRSWQQNFGEFAASQVAIAQSALQNWDRLRNASKSRTGST